MSVTAALVKELREKSGAGMMDCKKALSETDGDMESAIDWLRTKGLATAAKKSGRVAAEGLVGIAVDGTRGAVVELNAETDFVARNRFVRQRHPTGASLSGATVCACSAHPLSWRGTANSRRWQWRRTQPRNS